MVKRLGIILGIFFVLVTLDYVGTGMASAFSANGSSSLLAAIAPVPPSTGLTSVDFSIFSPTGKGLSYITQGYGDTPYAYLYVNHWHNGIDIGAQYGAPVYSPNDQVVFAVGDQDLYCPRKGFGRYVATIDTTNNVVLWYAHLGKISVTPGEDIHKGTEIGTIGDTGLETGAHLHFSVFSTAGFTMKDKYGCGPDADGKDMNPLPYLESLYK